jgi:glycerophosphoryl diester phosphodiesterase
MIIIAHRGESHDAPENTLAAINLAWQRNADAVEIDIHLTKDNKIVVIHNDSTWKFDGNFQKIKDQTLEELKPIDVGSHKGSQWADERIPELGEVLDTVPENKYIFIEIKSGTEILSQLKNVIDKSKLQPEQIKLICFDFDVMKKAREIFKNLEILWIIDIEYLEMSNSWQPEIIQVLEKIRSANLDGIDISASEIIDKTFVDIIKDAGFRLYVWTINDPTEAKRLMDAGVDGIATNRAHWLKMELGGSR